MPKARRGCAVRHLQTLLDDGRVAELTDGQLLTRFGAGGEGGELAFSVLVERHGPMVLRTCRAVLRDAHDSEDAFQATFLVLVRKAPSLRVRNSLGPWLNQVACRVSKNSRGGIARRRRLESRAAEATSQSVAGTAPDDLESVLQEELGRLPDRYRAAVVLCCLDGLTVEQAALRLGWRLGTLQSRLARGRERLRDRLRRRGLSPAGAILVAPAAQWRLSPVTVATGLAERTCRIAARVATGEAIAGVVPAPVSALTEGVLKAMFLTRLKLSAAVSILLLIIGSAIAAQQAGSGPSAGKDPGPAGSRPSTKPGDSPKPAGAEAYKQALATIEAMARENPREADHRAALARGHLALGVLSQERGRTLEAAESYRRACELLEALVREYPEVVAHRAELARALDRTGTLLAATGRGEEAMATHRKAIAIQERIIAEHPELAPMRVDLSRSYSRLGVLLQAIGRSEEAEGLLRRALEIQRRSVEAQPELVEPRSELAETYAALGALLKATGRGTEAEGALRSAQSIRERLVASPNRPGK